jgi:nicotinamidase-related amidase
LDQWPNLLLIDVQEKLFPKVQGYETLLDALVRLKSACLLLNIPILPTEQYPQGLGGTITPLRSEGTVLTKTAFSCLGDEKIRQEVLKVPSDTWILAGIETHVCVLQTAKDLLKAGKRVIIPVDAVSSRHKLDHETALKELARLNARITTIETLLFELLGDSKHPQFKAISQLVK